MSKRWAFGADPLSQTVRAAALLRRVTDLLVALEQEDAAVDRLIGDLEVAEAALRSVVPRDPAPRVGPAAPCHRACPA